MKYAKCLLRTIYKHSALLPVMGNERHKIYIYNIDFMEYLVLCQSKRKKDYNFGFTGKHSVGNVQYKEHCFGINFGVACPQVAFGYSSGMGLLMFLW